MTKEVLISISGVQLADGDNHDVEMITIGDYYQKNGKHYVIYDEVVESSRELIKNTIKIGADGLDIIKRGSSNVHMSFERNKKNVTCYVTPFGEMMIGIHTNQILVDEGNDNLKVQVAYSLDINYEHISECNITVDIKSKAKAELQLLS